MKELKEHYKLVRNNIPDILKNKGINCNFHIAGADEFEKELYKKLIEELEEFKENPCVEELADMLEVLDSMRRFHKINLNELKTNKSVKKEERGGFSDRIILDTTSE